MTKNRIKVSSRKLNGKKEYPTVNTRGEIELGIIFYVDREKTPLISTLKEALLKASGSKILWGEPQMERKITIHDNLVIFFPVQLHDEEKETAGNGLVNEHLKKSTAASLDIRLIERKLKHILESVWDMNIPGVRSISHVSNNHNTLT